MYCWSLPFRSLFILLLVLGDGSRFVEAARAKYLPKKYGVQDNRRHQSLLRQFRAQTSQIRALNSRIAQHNTRLSAAESGGNTARPPLCLPPSGILTHDGSRYVCSCDKGFSGVACEVGPSLSGLESVNESKIVGARAIADSGHNASHPFAASMDNSTAGYWESSASVDQYLDIDLQATWDISSLSIKSTGRDANTPDECTLLVGAAHSGPWLQVTPFRMVVQTDWQYFKLGHTTATRYVRIFFENTHTPSDAASRVRVAEVEIFRPNTGGLRTPGALPVPCNRDGGTLTYDEGVWSCRCRAQWKGPSCGESSGLKEACEAAGGRYRSSDDPAGDFLYMEIELCQFTGTSCPSGWVRMGEWGTTRKYGATIRTCPSNEHTYFADLPTETCYDGSRTQSATLTSVGCMSLVYP